jgi:hypothetical protein
MGIAADELDFAVFRLHLDGTAHSAHAANAVYLIARHLESPFIEFDYQINGFLFKQ